MNNSIIKDTIKIAMSNMLIVLSGIITGFLLPKILGVTDYGFYKIFNLYTTYTVFFDLGISNGIYLKYGGFERTSLPRKELRLYFKVLLLIQVIISLFVVIVASSISKKDYLFIILMTVVYGTVNNIATYFEKISIMTGEFNASIQRNISKSVLSILIVFVLLWAIKANITIRPYKIYTTLFVCIYILLAVQYTVYYKDIALGASDNYRIRKHDLQLIIKNGAILLVADTIANLILTLDRQFVSILFEIDIYAIYSFAYSMLKVIVLAISAIATVMYPILKRMSQEQMREMYISSLSFVEMIAFACLIAYYPLCLIVTYFLPAYQESLSIFRILFPSISINAVISLVMISHYKALNQQKVYFKITFFVLVLSFVTNIMAYILVGTPLSFSVASVITIVIWYVASDIKLKMEYGLHSKKQYLYMTLCIVGYYIITQYSINYYGGFLINSIYFLLITLIIYRNESHTVFEYLKVNIRKRQL